MQYMLRLVTLFAATLICTTLHAATPSADKIFPINTKGFFAIQNLKNFGEQWEQTQFGQLLNDPLMDNFKKEVQKQLTQSMEQTFGLTFDGLSSLPSGEVAFGMIAIPNQTPGYALTMDIAGKRTETDQYLENLTQKLTAASVKKTTVNFKGQPVITLIFPPPEQPRTITTPRGDITITPIERRAHYMILQDVLIASDQLPLLQLIADRMTAPAGTSLADVESYQAVMKRCLDDMPSGITPAIRWYIEPLDYGESVRVLVQSRRPAGLRRDKPSIFATLKQQGIDALQGIGGVISVSTEEQESVYRTFIYTKKPYRLAMRMFDFPESTNFAPPVWMPSDLARCTMIYVDPVAIFDNVGVLVDAVTETEGLWKDVLEGLETDRYGPKINVRNELVAHLGNRVLGMSRYDKPITVKSESMVVAVELKPGQEAAMFAGVKKLFGNDPEMQGTQHNSYVIWHRKPVEAWVPEGWDGPDIWNDGVPSIFGSSPEVSTVPVAQRGVAVAGEDESDRPPMFPEGGVVVAKGCLFVSSNVGYLKEVLDRLDSPAESARSTIGSELEYRAVDRIFSGMGLTDAPHFFQFFARTRETMRPTYEMIRKGQMVQSQALLGKLLNELLEPEEDGVRRQILDGGTLPAFEEVQHYFGTVGIFGVSESNGFFIKGFTRREE